MYGPDSGALLVGERSKYLFCDYNQLLTFRKKCDQIKPKCGPCSRRNSPCDWPVKGKEYKNKIPKRGIRFLDHNFPEIPTSYATPVQILTYINSSASLYSDENNPLDTTLQTDVIDGYIDNNLVVPSSPLSDSPVSLDTLIFPLYQSPSVPLCLKLSASETEHFEYYCHAVAPKISVVPNHLNHFLQVFLPLAYEDESVLYCLVAWGYTIRNHNKRLQQKNSFMDRAKTFLGGREHKFISSLASYIILMCIEITTGDTMAWSRYLTSCYDSINKMGGFGILKNYSEEGRALAENFAYFDILASQSNENGTYYPVYEYCNLFNTTNTGGFVDPLLGCTRPLILILGDVINLIVEIRALKENNCYTNTEKLQTILTKTEEIEMKLKSARIFTIDYQILAESNDNEMNYHRQMFELYRISIQMYVKQAIRRLPPNVPEMQLCLGMANEYLNSLIESPLRLGLSFPLLITGMNSVTEEDRNRTSCNLELLGRNYEFDSIDKLKQLIQEVWNLNKDGSLCIDYFEVTRKFGWKLNIGR